MMNFDRYRTELISIGVIIVIFFLGILCARVIAPWYLDSSRETDLPQQEMSQFKKELLNNKEKWRVRFQNEDAQDVYDSIIAVIPALSTDTHSYIHAVGELLYEEKDLEGLAFCDEFSGFGCYHGFFNAAIHANSVSILPLLDSACKQRYGEIDTRCQHGLGHGLLVNVGYEDLVSALDLCWTISQLATSGCTGGVFMEYNFHTMEYPGGEYLREIEEDVFSPCTDVPERYQDSCYQELPQLWTWQYDHDFELMGEMCGTLEEDTSIYKECFYGIGRIVSERVLYDFDAMVTACATMTNERTASLCREGASWLLIGTNGAQRETYLRLCDTLPSERKESCISVQDKISATPR